MSNRKPAQHRVFSYEKAVSAVFETEPSWCFPEAAKSLLKIQTGEFSVIFGLVQMVNTMVPARDISGGLWEKSVKPHWSTGAEKEKVEDAGKRVKAWQSNLNQ